MRFYSMTYTEVMNLPVKVFFSLYEYKQVLKAEEDRSLINSFRVAQAPGDDKHVSEYLSFLDSTAERGIYYETTFDEDGFNKLQMLLNSH